MAQTRANELPDLSKMSLNDIIDAFGDVKAEKKRMERLENYLKEALVARMPDDAGEYDTKRFHVTRATQSRTDLDRDLLKEEYGEEWYREHCVTTEFTVVRLKPIEPQEGG